MLRVSVMFYAVFFTLYFAGLIALIAWDPAGIRKSFRDSLKG